MEVLIPVEQTRPIPKVDTQCRKQTELKCCTNTDSISKCDNADEPMVNNIDSDKTVSAKITP